MESFESLVALAMRAENLHVSGPIKFMIKRKTKKKNYDEYQEHGYEVDLVGMRKDKLVLTTVKSFLGSQGVKFKEVSATSGSGGEGYRMLNDRELRKLMIEAACKQFGFETKDVEIRIYGGRFHSKDEAKIREWCQNEKAGGGPIQVYNLLEIMESVKELAGRKTYIDDPALVAVKSMLIADEFAQKAAKSSKAAEDFGFDRSAVSLEYPVSSRVVASKGTDKQVVGTVIGYSNQQTKNPYLKIREDDTNVVWIRVAKSCKHL
jgi:hypothetical protein